MDMILVVCMVCKVSSNIRPPIFCFVRNFERTLTVSTGIKKILHPAAAAEAHIVLAATGRSLVDSTLSSRVRTPVFAAVSPNRLIGPWIRAGRTPR